MKSAGLLDERPWNLSWWRYSEGNGSVLLYIVCVHALAIVGLVLYPIPDLTVLAIAATIASIGGIGTSVCYHRCLAHRSLRLNRVVENLLIFFTILNASGEPITWVANHRHHHAKADTSEDVSSPRHGGFWWAHIRWVYQWSGSEVRRWCPDLDKPRYRIWGRLQIPVVVLSMFGGLVLGWEAFFWIGAIRLVYAMHLQMFVNSLLHMTPGLPEGVDSSRNIWWLGPFQLGAWGENWHRNHHSDANAARFGRGWRQIDVGWYVIRLLKALKLAFDVRPSRRDIKNMRADQADAALRENKNDRSEIGSYDLAGD
jgi:stearoyl-CoA desaturase (delta-9 desaturase)